MVGEEDNDRVSPTRLLRTGYDDPRRFGTYTSLGDVLPTSWCPVRLSLVCAVLLLAVSGGWLPHTYSLNGWVRCYGDAGFIQRCQMLFFHSLPDVTDGGVI